MRPIIIASFLLSISLTACSSSSEPVAPDAPPSTVPRDPAGSFAIATVLDVAPPPPAALVIDALDRAASDPSRFILQRMLDTFPDGTTKSVAELALPYVAAYLDVKLAELCPRFVPGVRALASGFARIASHVELLEAWRITEAGDIVRAIGAAEYDVGPASVLAFGDQGLPDVTASARVELDEAGHAAIGTHAIAIRYGALVRTGLDLAVVPTAAPGTHDVAAALSLLVDCPRLGAAVADRVGLGAPALYTSACTAAMVHLAAELDEHVRSIDDAPLVLEAGGAALGLDLDHDGTLDELRSGRWTGTARYGAVSQPITATFTGTEGP